MLNTPADRWRVAAEILRDRDRRHHRREMTVLISESLFAFVCVAAAVFLIYTGTPIGVLLGFVGTNLSKIGRLLSIVGNGTERSPADEP